MLYNYFSYAASNEVVGGLTSDLFKGLEYKICSKWVLQFMCYEMIQHKTSFYVIVSKTHKTAEKGYCAQYICISFFFVTFFIAVLALIGVK